MDDDRQREHGTTAPVVAAVTVVGAALLIALNGLAGALDWTDLLTLSAAFTAFGLVGAAILRGDARNRMGWLFIAIFGAGALNGYMGILEEATDGPLAVALNNTTWWPVMALVFMILPLWFPTGRPPTHRWRWVPRLAVLVTVALVGLELFAERVCVNLVEEATETLAVGECAEWAANPIGISGIAGAEDGGVGDIFLLVGLVAILSAFVSIVLRFRRSEGIERLQLKWFVYAVSVIVGWAVIGDVLFIDVLGAEDVLFGDTVGSVVFGIALTGIPVSAGIAITRYRLYEIDRVINRTVVYAVVAGLLALLFVAGTVGVPALLPEGANDLVVAGTTLAAFFLFQPLRHRVQRAVDRRFYRSRYDAQQVADEFSVQLRDKVDPGEVGADWVDAVTQTMQPALVGVWMKRP